MKKKLKSLYPSDTTPCLEFSDAEKYADPSGLRRMIGCSQERVEEQLRIALDGNPESELWGENGLIAATMRAANATTNFPALDDAACYRLLDHNDTISVDDEFLEDDCITWTLIGIQHRWNVGCYWHTALKPMRRISGDNSRAQSAAGFTDATWFK